MDWGIVFLITLGLFAILLIAYIVLNARHGKKLAQIKKKKKGEE